MRFCMKWSWKNASQQQNAIFKQFPLSFFSSREPNMHYLSFSRPPISRYLLTPIYRLLNGGVCPKPSIKAPQRERRVERGYGVERESIERENPSIPFHFLPVQEGEGEQVSVSFLCPFLKLQPRQSNLYNVR